MGYVAARFDGKLAAMPVVISMLRGVNLGAHRRIKMDALRDLYASLKLRDPQTYVQSGNVVFSTEERDLLQLSQRIEKAIERGFGFHTDVILRTTAELRSVVARNPCAKRKGIEPSRLLVNFLAGDPGPNARKALRGLKIAPEQLWIDGRELYIYFPNGMARPKLSWAAIDRILETPGTGRNWNSVTKLLQLAEKLETTI
jgi:uncharacterized protein (DUF1697 family)